MADRIKKCRNCGEEFTGGGYKYCGAGCVTAFYKKHPRYIKKSPISCKCPTCGKVFIKGGRGSGNRKYCSEGCWQGHFTLRDRRWAVRKPIPCLVCGKEFLQSFGKQLTCSDECSRKNQKQKENSRRHPVFVIRFCRGCGGAFKPKTKNSWFCSRMCSYPPEKIFAERECQTCGAGFMPKNKFGKFCSNRCQTRHSARSPNERRRRGGMKMYRKRSREAGVAYEPINPIKLFERDGWKCQICGVKTPRSLRGSYEDRAPELDHRLAMASGGSHTWDNVQCTCRKCNMIKGNRATLGQLRLFNHPAALSK